MIRILIVDDHPVVRTGIHGMLAGHDEFFIVGEAVDGAEALKLVAKHQPDVVLMDLRMPNMNGTEATRRIVQTYPDTHVLILTTYDDDKDIINALDAGAIGYLLKDAPREDLYRAIRSASEGQSALNPVIARRLIDRVTNPQPQNPLSLREIAVLKLVADGNTNKQIGTRLHISEATVKTHLIHIYRKLDAADRAEAVSIALRAGYLADADDMDHE